MLHGKKFVQASLMKQQKQVVSSKREAKQTNAQLIPKAIVKTAEETSAMY